jgi:hypothetical protein
MLGKNSAKTALEGAAAFHWRLTWHQEHSVLRHETEDGADVTRGGCPVPIRNEIANGLFVSIHVVSISNRSNSLLPQLLLCSFAQLGGSHAPHAFLRPMTGSCGP